MVNHLDRSPIRRDGPRALLLLLGVPAVAFIVDVVVPVADGRTMTAVARVLIFTAAILCLLRCIMLRTGRKPNDLHDASVWFAGLCLGSLACIRIPSQPPVSTLIILIAVMTAIVEEYIFRRRLPEVLEELLNDSVPSRTLWAIAVVAAQIAFATCHFVTVGHLQPFGDGLPILRMFAAGCFLAVIVLFAGLPTAVLVHATTNVLIQTSIAGRFEIPTNGVILVYSALGIACVIATGMVQHAAGGPAIFARPLLTRAPTPAYRRSK